MMFNDRESTADVKWSSRWFHSLLVSFPNASSDEHACGWIVELKSTTTSFALAQIIMLRASFRWRESRPSTNNPEVHLATPQQRFKKTNTATECTAKLMQMRQFFCCYRALSLKPFFCSRDFHWGEKSRLTRDDRPPAADFSFVNYTKNCFDLKRLRGDLARMGINW